jgi:hypothetical protein
VHTERRQDREQRAAAGSGVLSARLELQKIDAV